MIGVEPRLLPTSAGPVAGYLPLPRHPEAPVVVFLHGALRRSEALFGWSDRFAGLADVAFLDLPGHGRSAPDGPASVAGMAGVVDEALRAAFADRRAVLVGESLGGLVALAIGGMAAPGPVRAVLACDPFMSTRKLWNVIGVFRRLLADPSTSPFVRRLADEAFGIGADGVAERLYYPLVAALKVPAAIATGDTPLLPQRPLTGVACVFDEVDAFVVRALGPPDLRIAAFPRCGHLVLTDAADACRALIAELVAVATRP